MKEFSWEVRVYYEDTDAGGVVYHANYLKFMEQARTEWLRDLGYSQHVMHDEHSTIFTVTKLDIRYRSPARIDELLTITSSTTNRGGASIDFHQSITNETGKKICDANVTVACIDTNTFKPKRLPEQLKIELTNGS